MKRALLIGLLLTVTAITAWYFAWEVPAQRYREEVESYEELASIANGIDVTTRNVLNALREKYKYSAKAKAEYSGDMAKHAFKLEDRLDNYRVAKKFLPVKQELMTLIKVRSKVFVALAASDSPNARATPSSTEEYLRSDVAWEGIQKTLALYARDNGRKLEYKFLERYFEDEPEQGKDS